MNTRSKLAGFVSFFLSAAILIGSGLAVFQRQAILDWWRLREYEPSAAVAKLSSDASLSDLGEKLFYVHDPELLQKESFGSGCSLTEETIVLGCYITHDKIYVFDVDDERLEGVEQVTAAHETLHAAYDRLSSSEKDRINALVLAEYQSLNNERLQRNVESYRLRDASIVPNELHSILGTEVLDLSAELEEYYSQYFIDRSLVVTAAQSYEGEFTRRETQIEALDIELQQLDAQIEQQQNQVLLLGNAIEQERSSLDALRSSDSAAYNAAVPGFNDLVRNYNARVESYRIIIEEYNVLVAQRNSIALEERELIEAIDTRTTEL